MYTITGDYFDELEKEEMQNAWKRFQEKVAELVEILDELDSLDVTGEVEDMDLVKLSELLEFLKEQEIEFDEVDG